MNNLRVYLKICEGCGSLWLRTGEGAGVYCRGCSVRLADFPAPHAGKCRNTRVRGCGRPAVGRRSTTAPDVGVRLCRNGVRGGVRTSGVLTEENRSTAIAGGAH
jgi:hypothetical protein